MHAGQECFLEEAVSVGEQSELSIKTSLVSLHLTSYVDWAGIFVCPSPSVVICGIERPEEPPTLEAAGEGEDGHGS